MYDEDYETKPISLITDKEHEQDIIEQSRLFKMLMESGYETKSICIFERIDARFSLEKPVHAIVTFAMSNDNMIGAIQVSNPYFDTYRQRFYLGSKKSLRYYNKLKETGCNYPTAKIIWEGLNNNAKLS